MKLPHSRASGARWPSLALCLLLICLTPLYSSMSHAQARGTASSEQEAARIALSQTGNTGKVLGVSTRTDGNGQKVYAVKVLDQGRVRVILIAQAR